MAAPPLATQAAAATPSPPRTHLQGHHLEEQVLHLLARLLQLGQQR